MRVSSQRHSPKAWRGHVRVIAVASGLAACLSRSWSAFVVGRSSNADPGRLVDGCVQHRSLRRCRSKIGASQADMPTEASADPEASVAWLTLPRGPDVDEASSGQAAPSPKFLQDVPVLVSQVVFFPGEVVVLQLSSPTECAFYEELILKGTRQIVLVLSRTAKELGTDSPNVSASEISQVTEYGTLVTLEDLRDISAATDGKAKYAAEHTAIGRVRLRNVQRQSEGSKIEVFTDAEILDADSDSQDTGAEEDEARKAATDVLTEELMQLAKLQHKTGGPSVGDTPAGDFAVALAAPALIGQNFAEEKLPELQGLWRANTGSRVRVQGDAAIGLGPMLPQGEGEYALKVGEAWYYAKADDNETSPVDILHWDDGGNWTRLAAPAAFVGAPEVRRFWQLARAWRQAAVMRIEVQRRSRQFQSLDQLRDFFDAGIVSAHDTFEKDAQEADDDAARFFQQEVMVPCQRVLQAGSYVDLLKTLADILQPELQNRRLQAMLAATEAESAGET
eukprot:TRINITY_DN33098_c0_g1_i1.p1 TRINITY_DN33098_c0_g1~~TRINITY_DN33098_c0_g1_i1.p1  ORF type:complete len:507 (+),score=112.92 TRINITY_DN33098_c0_g1_i1:63-1583(+)